MFNFALKPFFSSEVFVAFVLELVEMSRFTDIESAGWWSESAVYCIPWAFLGLNYGKNSLLYSNQSEKCIGWRVLALSLRTPVAYSISIKQEL